MFFSDFWLILIKKHIMTNDTPSNSCKPPPTQIRCQDYQNGKLLRISVLVWLSNLRLSDQRATITVTLTIVLADLEYHINKAVMTWYTFENSLDQILTRIPQQDVFQKQHR